MSASPKEPEGAGPAIISDHEFVPRDKWFGLCGHVADEQATAAASRYCNLGEAAHARTSLVRPTRGPTGYPRVA